MTKRSTGGYGRALWAACTRMSDDRLAEEIRKLRYLTTDPRCITLRGKDGEPWAVDVWYLRMYTTEARRRAAGTAVRVEHLDPYLTWGRSHGISGRKPRRKANANLRAVLAAA